MKKDSRKGIVRLMATILAASIVLLAAGCGGSPAQEAPREIPAQIGGISTGEHKAVATVNGEDIYEDVFMQWYLNTLAINYGLDMTQTLGEQEADFIESYKLSYLSSYIGQVALFQDAKKEEIVVEDDAVKAYIEEIAGYYGVSVSDFASIREMMGFSAEEFHNYLKDALQISALYEKKTAEITAPETEPWEYYNQYPAMFRTEEERTVRHILVEREEEAQDIIAALSAGTAFADLVSRSIDPSAVSNQGQIGPFYSDGSFVDGSGGLVEPFYLASYLLAGEGEFTKEPVESDFGFHVIILDLLVPSQAQSFDEVKDQLAEELLYEARDSFFEAHYQALLAAAEITYTEGYDPDAPVG